ncbi:MAG: T9SS type A sorting domain-containing protein [Ginsengibacter sp.]
MQNISPKQSVGYRLKILLILALIVSRHQNIVAQTSYNDSLYFETVFQTPVYINYYLFPGKLYIHPFVQTRAGLFDSLNSIMKFAGQEFYGAYDNMHVGNLYPLDSINASLNYYYSLDKSHGYKQTNPVFGLPFSLNGKNSSTYCTYTPATNSSLSKCNTAVLFITGSGTNNGTEMVRGDGYQNSYGFMKDSLATLGDVYIAIRPLIDFRAFVWDKKDNPVALNSEFPIPNQITSYLLARETPYGVNCLIESIAIVKYLKSKYQKVIIAGLSYGGIYTTLNTFESAPEGALISGGYTITVDETSINNDYQLGSFGPLFYALNRDSVKRNISKSTTEFLFSWGRGGDITEETNLHYTENYFSGLNNTQYFYDYANHTYPPFSAFKNLLDRVNIHTSVRIQEIEKTCNPASVKIMISFCGQKPYRFDIYKDSLLYGSYTSAGDNFQATFNDPGVYKVKNLFDANNVPGYNSDNYIFKPNNDIDIKLSRQKWNCNMTQDNVFKLTGGDGPWDIYYRKNGTPASVIFYTGDRPEFSWPDGTYIIDSINNYGNCMKYINDTIVVDSKISQSEKLFSFIFFNAGSAKEQMILQAGFNGYKKIFFTKNGIIDSADIENNMFLLSGGTYQFTGVMNDSNCIFPLNTRIILAGDSSQLTISNPAVMSAYPNPFAKQFNLLIELPSNQHPVLDIFNVSGKKVKSFEIENGSNTINMEGVKKGMYILKIRYKGKGYSFDTLKMIML